MILLICLPYSISLFIGFFILRNLTLSSTSKLPLPIELIYSFGLGLAVSSFLAFSCFIVLNKFNAPYIITANILALCFSAFLYFYRRRKNPIKPSCHFSWSWKNSLLLLIYLLLLIPAWYWSTFFLHGGWDAWSTWNLKARILFLGGEHWKNMFSPILWRASPHYPLLLPLMNVWGWSFQTAPIPEIPLATSFIFLNLTLLLVYFSLRYLLNTRWAFAGTMILLSHAYYMKIAMSQYCDIVVSFYLLAGIISLILSRNHQQKIYAFIAGLNLGILCFSKPEGLVAAGILIVLSLFHLWNKDASSVIQKLLSWIYLVYGFLITVIPTLIFQLFYSPGNQTMINGFQSSDHPVTWDRFDVIWKFYAVELMGDTTPWSGIWVGAWRGIWTALFIGLVIGMFKKMSPFEKSIRIIPWFILSYMSVITFYYLTNTYFPIAWWLQVTLHRIYFSLLPIVLFWIFYSVWGQERKI